MAYATGFLYDLFISYARIDNEPSIPGDATSCWVSTFKEALRTHLAKEIGAEVEVFFDLGEVQGNEQLSTQLREAVRSSAALVVINSRAGLTREYCRQERAAFLGPDKRAAKEGRVFVVHRDDLKPEEWQSEIAPELFGYPFFETDRVSAVLRVLGEPRLEASDRTYFLRLKKLCVDLGAKLRALKLGQQPSLPDAGATVSPAETAAGAARPSGQTQAIQPAITPTAPSTLGTIFLAETTPDLMDLRDQMRTFLVQSDFDVVPNRFYMRQPEEFRHAAERDLASALAFVQLLGPYRSSATEDLPDGYEILQADCASRAGKPIFRWRPRGLDLQTLRDEKYRALLGGERVRAVDLEEFKQQLLADLRRALAKQSVTPPPPGTDRYLAIAAPDNDREAQAIAEQLQARNLAYDIVPEQHALTDVATSEDYDALLVVYNRATPVWVSERVRQCRQVVMKKRDTAPVCGVYVCPPLAEHVLLTQPPRFHRILKEKPADFEGFLSAVLARPKVSAN